MKKGVASRFASWHQARCLLLIARFFREIERADELGSGMWNMMKYGKAYGGENPEMIEGDVFRTIVKYPDSALYEEGLAFTTQVEAQVEAHEAQVDITTIEKTILGSCKDRPKTGQEILAASGYSTRTGNFKRSLEKMLSLGLIEMTIPDKPRSSKQKYRLTDAGKHLLESIQE